MGATGVACVLRGQGSAYKRGLPTLRAARVAATVAWMPGMLLLRCTQWRHHRDQLASKATFLVGAARAPSRKRIARWTYWMYPCWTLDTLRH